MNWGREYRRRAAVRAFNGRPDRGGLKTLRVVSNYGINVTARPHVTAGSKTSACSGSGMCGGCEMVSGIRAVSGPAMWPALSFSHCGRVGRWCVACPTSHSSGGPPVVLPRLAHGARRWDSLGFLQPWWPCLAPLCPPESHFGSFYRPIH